MSGNAQKTWLIVNSRGTMVKKFTGSQAEADALIAKLEPEEGKLTRRFKCALASCKKHALAGNDWCTEHQPGFIPPVRVTSGLDIVIFERFKNHHVRW
jgi:hypothetical protein